MPPLSCIESLQTKLTGVSQRQTPAWFCFRQQKTNQVQSQGRVPAAKGLASRRPVFTARPPAALLEPLWPARRQNQRGRPVPYTLQEKGSGVTKAESRAAGASDLAKSMFVGAAETPDMDTLPGRPRVGTKERKCENVKLSGAQQTRSPLWGQALPPQPQNSGDLQTVLLSTSKRRMPAPAGFCLSPCSLLLDP